MLYGILELFAMLLRFYQRGGCQGAYLPLWTFGYTQCPNIGRSVNFAHSIRLLRYKDFNPSSCREVFFNVDNAVSLDLGTSWVSANLDVYVRYTGYPPTIRKKYQTGRSTIASYAGNLCTEHIASNCLSTAAFTRESGTGTSWPMSHLVFPEAATGV